MPQAKRDRNGFESPLWAIFELLVGATSTSKDSPRTPRGRTGRRSEGDLCRNGQFHLGALAKATLQAKLCTDPLRGLSHSRKSPMTIAAVAQDLGLNSASVVPHKQAQVVIAVSQLHFDIRGP